ncbi:MAG: alpha-mannosidase, partial [Chloroflexota bacterium]|nr:alpha-mannosidase [Chloroflexota bacterium]
MNTYDTHRMERHARRMQELRSWRNAREHAVDQWRLTVNGESYPVRLGERWPVVETPVEITGTIKVPDDFRGDTVELELWLGGEGYVELSNGVSGGLNAMHRFFAIADPAQGGEQLQVRAEVSPKAIFGTNIPSPALERAHLLVPEADLRALERDLTMTLEACSQLRDYDVASHLLDIVDAAFVTLAPAWPSGTETSLARFITGRDNPLGSGAGAVAGGFGREAVDVYSVARSLWSLPPVPRPLEPLPEEARAAVRQARAVVAERLESLKAEFPPAGRVALTGHAHIDLAWLWPVAETQRKCRRTFASVLDLMDRYEDFTFNQSSAQAYSWIEEQAPELFERIRRRIEEGRWEDIGGSWCEQDSQVTGGESMVRQLFYGQRYFEEKFGRRHTVAWLPDVFGFSPGIPQLLLGAGIPYFFTIKVNWNETNVLPYDIFEWEGIDGSRVLAHTFNNPGQGYNGN